MQIGAVRRLPIAMLPTPLQKLRRLTDELGGPRIFVKRDDLTGLALGGNKLRKLEYALAEAEASKATCVITTGAVQSNHCRLTVAACNTVGLPCHLLLRGSEPDHLSGNLLLDHLLGAASIRFIPGPSLEIGLPRGQTPTQQAAEDLRTELESRGERPYLLPNGCKPLHGALAYAHCVREMAVQLHEQNLAPDVLVTACGGAGTQTGLVLGSELFCGSSPRVIGISVGQPQEVQASRVADGLAEAYAFLKRPEPGHDIVVNDQFIGPGYGLPTAEMGQAIRLTARLESLILDPVYTGKAMAGLIHLIRRGDLDQCKVVVFVHTGGVPALFAAESAKGVRPLFSNGPVPPRHALR